MLNCDVMLRYLTYLAIYIPVQLFAYLITPLLPLFAVKRMGGWDNNSYRQTQPRLPIWLSWFDTPDNSLLGDSRWMADHTGSYWSMVCWLYRNSLYGFKWTVLAVDVQDTQIIIGNPDIGYQRSRFGILRIRQPNGAWQFKIVKPIFGKIFEGNFGWLLDDTTKQRALFMFSPRIKGIQND